MKLFHIWNLVLIGILVSILTSHVYTQVNLILKLTKKIIIKFKK